MSLLVGGGGASARRSAPVEDDQGGLLPLSSSAVPPPAAPPLLPVACPSPAPPPMTGPIDDGGVWRPEPAAQHAHSVRRDAGAHQGVERSGLSGRWRLIHLEDSFTTLLNMPTGRFLFVFVAASVGFWAAFAVPFLLTPEECIPGMRGNFTHALYFSMQLATTLGWVAPSMDCTWTNVWVVVEVILSSLLNYALLGVVFSRFSSPAKRALAMRFSSSVAVHRGPASGPGGIGSSGWGGVVGNGGGAGGALTGDVGGAHKPPQGGGASGSSSHHDNQQQQTYWRLTLRVASVRKHVLLSPEIECWLARPCPRTRAEWRFFPLALEDVAGSLANLKLGYLATLTHVVSPSSPLWGLSPRRCGQLGLELHVFLSGVDAMTSNATASRAAYRLPLDLRMNHRLASVYVTGAGGRHRLDFTGFDTTVPDLPPSQQAVSAAVGVAAAAGSTEALLEELTFEQLAALPVGERIT